MTHMKKRYSDLILFEKISTIIISVILVAMAFLVMVISGTPSISMYQGMSIIFYIIITIILLMIYIRISEIKIKGG